MERVALKVDGNLMVQALSKNSTRTIEKLSDALGSQPTDHVLADAKDLPQLSGLEWELIDALIDEPTMALKDLIKATGLSPKTVRKHLERLTDDEAVFITPRLDQLSDSG
jgi:DNA-binding MarR family transcriptional regulator